MKNKSVRIKLTLLFVSIIALVLLLLLCANTFGLEKYYLNYKVKNLKSAYTEINRIVSDNNIYDGDTANDLKNVLTGYSDTYNISIALINTYTSEYIVSTERGSDGLYDRMLESIIRDKNGTDKKNIEENSQYIISVGSVGSKDTQNVELTGYSDDGNIMMIMSSPVDNIKINSKISNKFLIIIGAVLLAISTAVIYFASNKIDVTIRSLQRDLDERIKQEKIRSDFIANVSHELKTPLALIQGYAEGLSEGLCEDEASRKEYCDIINDEAEKMNRIVKQMLALNSIESGSEKLSLNSFDISELLDGLIDSTLILADEKHVDIKKTYDNHCMVIGDEEKLESVITNFLSNAYHHVNENGSIEVKATLNKDVYRISVFNTGSHIPDEDIEHIWEKFYKVDKAHSRVYEGTGIGLSIVEAIMKSHQMPYGVINRSEGVEFYIELKKSNDR